MYLSKKLLLLLLLLLLEVKYCNRSLDDPEANFLTRRVRSNDNEGARLCILDRTTVFFGSYAARLSSMESWVPDVRKTYGIRLGGASIKLCSIHS